MRQPKAFSYLLCVLALSLAPCLTASAQDSPVQPPKPTSGSRAEPTFTLDVKSASLRPTLETLFTQAKVNYLISEDVPDAKITLRTKDITLSQMLSLILREGSKGGKRLTYTVESGVYSVRVVPEAKSPLVLDKLPLTYRRPGEMIPSIEGRFPQADIVDAQSDNALLIRADVETLNAIREMVRILDVKPREFIVKAEVVMVAENAKKEKGAALVSTIVRATTGKEAEGEDKVTGTPAQTSSLSLRVKVYPLGDGTFEVDNQWTMSLPLNIAASGNKPATLVRLEKRSSGTSRVKPGETNVVGGVVLKQYGLSGEILLFLTLSPTDEAPAKP